MNTMRTTFFPLLMGILLVSFHCNAQVGGCSDDYEAALRLYNSGMAESALNTLKPCLESKQAIKQVSRETAANMFRLAALSSIMMGNTDDADSYITQLLRYQPDYKNNMREDDLEEFRLLITSKSAQPDLMVGVKVGMNMPFLGLEKNYTDPAKSAATYTLDGSTGFQLGLTAEKALGRSLALAAGAGMTQVSFSYLIRSSQTGHYQYDQSITYLEVPVMLRYYLTSGGAFKPYLQGGISGKFSLYLREKSDDYGSYWLTESENSSNILATFHTGLENVGLAVGTGASFQLKSFTLNLDIRYAHHLNSSGKLSKFDSVTSYDDIPSSEPFGYTNDINLITLKDLQISLGFAYHLKYKVY